MSGKEDWVSKLQELLEVTMGMAIYLFIIGGTVMVLVKVLIHMWRMP